MMTIRIGVFPSEGYPYHRRTTLIGCVASIVDLGAVGNPGHRVSFWREGTEVVAGPEFITADVLDPQWYGRGSGYFEFDVPGLGTVVVHGAEGDRP